MTRPTCECCGDQLTLAELGTELAELHRVCPGRLTMQLALSAPGEDKAALVFLCAGCGGAGEYAGTRAEGEAALAHFAKAGPVRQLTPRRVN